MRSRERDLGEQPSQRYDPRNTPTEDYYSSKNKKKRVLKRINDNARGSTIKWKRLLRKRKKLTGYEDGNRLKPKKDLYDKPRFPHPKKPYDRNNPRSERSRVVDH